MSVVAGMIFTGAGREADPEMLKECKNVLVKHTGMFSRFRKNVDLVLESRMAMSDDPEKYIEAVIDTHNKIRKAKMKDNDFTIIAAALVAGCYRENSAANDNAYISSTLGILKDRQTAALISAMVQIIPGIAEAVFSADRSKESDPTEDGKEQ